MIVDTLTHVWQSVDQLGPQISAQLRARFGGPTERLDATPTTHLDATECTDIAFVLGYRSVHLHASVPARFVSAYISQRPDRLIGFAGIDPLEDGYLDQVAQLRSLRLDGVVISPAEQGYHPCHSAAMALYEKCQSMNLPIIVLQGGHRCVRDSMLEYAQPHLLDEVARSFPQLRLLIAHCGFPWTDQTLALIGKHRNVYAELSGVSAEPWLLYNVLLRGMHMGVLDRLLFGSDFPHQRPEQVIEVIYSLNHLTQGTAMHGVPRERLRTIVERDALAALGLKRSSSPAAPPADPPPASEPEPAPAPVTERQGETRS